MSQTWCTIESDPGVFTELIESIGVRGAQMEEIYSLDNASFARLKPVYGLIFLFKWTGESDARPTRDAGSEPELFFAHQVIPNACATQAILSVLLNCADKIDIGEALTDFKAFTREFPPGMKGLSISNSEMIRSVHNGFSRQEPFFNDDKDSGGKKEDAFHFVAYVPHKGKVFELDGLKSGPILLGEIPPTDVNSVGGEDECEQWLSVASPAIEERIARYSSGEIRFNLMAIVKNRKQVSVEGRDCCMRRVDAINRALTLGDAGERGIDGDPSFVLAQGNEALERQRERELHAAKEHEITIANEESKFTQWRTENVRRKHNYVPFAVALLTALAGKGEMQGLMESAAAKANERQQARVGAKRKAESS